MVIQRNPVNWATKLRHCSTLPARQPLLPKGDKGLNPAAPDIHYHYQGPVPFYTEDNFAGLKGCSVRTLARVWKA